MDHHHPIVAEAAPDTRLERWSRHPLGIAIRTLGAFGAIFFAGLTIVIGVFGYTFKRPADALWTERFLESFSVGVLGVVVGIMVLVAAWRPTPRRLLAAGLIVIAAPLLGRAI